jgi:hypothetical protein
MNTSYSQLDELLNLKNQHKVFVVTNSAIEQAGPDYQSWNTNYSKKILLYQLSSKKNITIQTGNN